MLKRLSLIFVALSLTLGVALADENPRFWVLNSFEKGLNSHIDDLKTPDNMAHDAENVRFNVKFGSLAKRDYLLTYGDAGVGAVMGLHRYYKTDDTSYLIAGIGTYLKLGDDNAGTFSVIKQGLTDSRRWQFVTYKNIAIATNGADKLQKYDGNTVITDNTDGARTSGDSCTELGAPFAELNTGANLDASSWYQYKVAYYDGTNYYYSTSRSNPILTGATVRDVTLTNIPIGETGTTARYVYRTLGNASRAACIADNTFYKIATIANNTTTTINDAMDDATASGDATPTWATVSAGTNVTPPIGAIAEIHNERLFISGNTVYPSDVYWSDLFNPDYFLPESFVAVREDDGDKVTFLKSFLGLLTIAKTNTLQKFYTDGDVDTNWYLSNPLSFIGCPATYTASVSPKGIVYLSRNGIYLFNGQFSQLISDSVTPEINDISQTSIEDCAGYYYANEYRLAYTSETTGQNLNNRVLLYDFIRDAYTLDTENINCFASFDAGNDFGTLYSGSSTSDGYVFAHSGSSSILKKRYKSEIQAGTFDDTRVFGTENEPIVELAWDCTIDGWLAEMQSKEAGVTMIDNATLGTLALSIIDRPDTDGVWTSPIYDVNASIFDKLYWNELLGSYGDITFQARTGATTLDCLAAPWSTAVSNPSGSDISGLSGLRYLQLRSNLSTSNIDYSPNLFQTDGFVFKVTYSKIGAGYESSVLSRYETGWKDLGVTGYLKLIKRIMVYYEGTEGTIDIEYKNEQGDIDKTFSIDCSIDPNVDPNDHYTGVGTTKVYTYYPQLNTGSDPSPIGQYWKFFITEDGITTWSISKIEVEYNVEQIY